MGGRPRSPGRRGLLLAAAGMALGGCGFKPLYGQRDGGSGVVQNRLAEVNVLLIPERQGQLLRQALLERFERSGAGAAPRYDLSVQFGLTAEPIAIQQDSSVTRIRMIGTASWSLLSQPPQRATLANGTVRDVDGFDIINQQFFAVELSREALQRRMADSLAEKITTQLAIYFDRKAAA